MFVKVNFAFFLFIWLLPKDHLIVLAKLGQKHKISYMEPGGTIRYQPGQFMLNPDLQIYCFNGSYKSLSKLFETIELQLEIFGTDFQQYEGKNVEEVLEHYEQHRSLFSFTLFSQKRTRLQLSPFEHKCIGVETSQPYVVRLLKLRVDFWRVLQLCVGVLLFLNTARLSENSFFYYTTGILLGICFSFMLLIWLSSKLVPRRSLMYGVIIGGWSIGVYLANMIWENLQVLIVTYRNFVIWYIIITGLISFCICYRWGPPSDKRSKDIVNWVLQLVSFAILYVACAFEEVAVAIMVATSAYRYFPNWLWHRMKSAYRRKYPPKRRLLTNEEYLYQGVHETKKALKELREYARSPECAQWRVMQKLRNPTRFAQFVEGASHLTNNEIMNYAEDPRDEDEGSEWSENENIEVDENTETYNNFLSRTVLMNDNNTSSSLQRYNSPVTSPRLSLNTYINSRILQDDSRPLHH